jgi:hypothetical protein
MTDEPLRHVRRVTPPWDVEVRTECGRKENDVKVIVERTEAIAFVKKFTMARAVFVHCTVCLDRLRYGAPTWEKGAVDVTSNWLTHRYSHGETERLERHLHALAALVERHPEEYQLLLAPNVPTLAQHRRDRGRR